MGKTSYKLKIRMKALRKDRDKRYLAKQEREKTNINEEIILVKGRIRNCENDLKGLFKNNYKIKHKLEKLKEELKKLENEKNNPPSEIFEDIRDGEENKE